MTTSTPLLLALFCLTITCTAATEPALLGVNLGQRYLTAAFFNGSRVHPAGRIEGVEAYTNLMTEISQDLKASHNFLGDQQAVLKDALSTILAEAQGIDGDSVRIGAIAYPAHFHDNHTAAVLNALSQLQPEFVPFESYGMLRLNSSHKNTMITYPGDHCPKKLFADGGRIVEDDDPLVLLFETSFDKLHVVLGGVGTPGAMIDEKQRIEWPASVEDIQGGLQHSSIYPLLSKVVSVIFSSENAATDFSKVRAALEKEASSLLNRIQVPAIGLEYTAATGAACRARQITTFSHVLQPLEKSHYSVGDEYAFRLTCDDGDTRSLTLEDLLPEMPANCYVTSDTDPLQGCCAWMSSATMDEWLLQREETFLSVGGCVLSKECNMPFGSWCTVDPECTCACDGELTRLSDARCEGSEGDIPTRSSFSNGT